MPQNCCFFQQKFKKNVFFKFFWRKFWMKMFFSKFWLKITAKFFFLFFSQKIVLSKKSILGAENVLKKHFKSILGPKTLIESKLWKNPKMTNFRFWINQLNRLIFMNNRYRKESICIFTPNPSFWAYACICGWDIAIFHVT